MKSEFTRTISPTLAALIAGRALKNLSDAIAALPSDDPTNPVWDYCASKREPGYLWYSPDETGANITASLKTTDFGELTVWFFSTTCGNSHHALCINVSTGLLTAYHNGARRSYPGLLFSILPDEFFRLNDCENWTLTSVETSEPTWAVVSGLLRGKCGAGPRDAEHAAQLAAINDELNYAPEWAWEI